MDDQASSVASESDGRTTNNSGAVRHNYRVLTDDEKAQMVAIKGKGEELLDLIDRIPFSPREKALGKTNIEQGVMWAVKALTA